MEQNNVFLNRVKKRKIWTDFFSYYDFEIKHYKSPNTFFNSIWSEFTKYKKKIGNLNNSIPGSVLEIISLFVFDHEKIAIESMDEEVKGVYYVKPDFIIQGVKQKIFVSCKTSVRERWKQADYEALKYKSKFPNTKCFLLMNDEREGKNLKDKLPRLDIDNVFISHYEFDSLIEEIKSTM